MSDGDVVPGRREGLPGSLVESGLVDGDSEIDGETGPAGGIGELASRPVTTVVPATTTATTAATVTRAAVRRRFERARARTASRSTAGDDDAVRDLANGSGQSLVKAS